MSEALTRVIAEQQSKIDNLEIIIASKNKSLESTFKRQDELFEAWARLLDSEEGSEEYRRLRHEVRMQILETGYCLRCYNFSCECNYEE
jgi:hypothetical protein